jgi:glutamate:GABA antiporter
MSKLKLGVFSLVMITLGSVDSIRNLPATALFGSSLIFYFLLGAIFFLLPSALVSAELSSTSKMHGGVYAWVKQALGPQMGFLAVWFQWTENVIWYPTILSFVAGSIGYLINPALAHSKVFLVSVILVAFWGATLINLLGVRSSARFANFCTLSGLIIPMTLIIALGITWLAGGRPVQIHFTLDSMLPHMHQSGMWVALTGVMMSFCGMEIATVHSGDVNNPQKAYPRAMLITVLVLVVTLILGALAIAIVLPNHQISLVAGIMQAFSAFFDAYHMHWILPVIAIMLVIGGMGSVSNWIIAPTRGLQIAAADGHLPKICQKQNRFNSPHVLLLSQAVISTFMSMAFLLMPSVNGSYWLLTALAAQQYMLMYIIMFIAGIRWRYARIEKEAGYEIPGGRNKSHWGMWLVGLAGLLGSVVTFIIGFIPPSNIAIGGTVHYETLLLSGLVIMTFLPFFLKARR